MDDAVLDELARQLSHRAAAATAHGIPFAQWWQLAHTHALGGKLVRPRLLIETATALSGGSPTPAVRATVTELAVAVELLHYAFLLHDDVIDDDTVRRYGPNLLGSVRDTHPAASSDAAAHWGMTAGILMGDLMLSAAHQGFARLDVRHPVRLRLLDLLDHAITETVAGEQLDVALSDGVVTPDLATILSMTTLKTATYSFELPLRAAAIMTGHGPAVEQSLTAVGRHLGLAFQLNDDLLGAFGSPDEHGKQDRSDFTEGKQTVIMAHARTTAAWPRIEPLLGDPELSASQADELRALLIDCGAQRFTYELIDDQLSAVSELLAAATHVPPPCRQMLRSWASVLDGAAA